MTRIEKGSTVLLLLVPLLLGSAASDKRVSSKDVTVHDETVKTGSEAERAPASTTQQPAPTPTTGVSDAPAPSAGSSATNYSIGWYSINGGGTVNASSPNYRMGSSVGQSVAGAAKSASYQMGTGFWYGASGCNCPHQGDITSDGVIDVFDVIGLIDIAFSGGADIHDPGCPGTRADVDNNGVPDVFDVIYIIATAFSGGANPIDPCNP